MALVSSIYKWVATPFVLPSKPAHTPIPVLVKHASVSKPQLEFVTLASQKRPSRSTSRF